MTAVSRPNRPKKCFYSILQYTPNSYRQEAVNLAVIAEAPEIGFRGAKYLRYMDSTLKALDPLADVEMIRSYVRGIEEKFKRSEIQMNAELRSSVLFEEIRNPSGLDEIIHNIRSSGRLPFKITDRKPVFFPSEQAAIWKLESLYNSLVYRPREKTIENFDKDYVRQTSLTILERFIGVELGTEPIIGLSYKDNEFDAAQKNASGDPVSYIEFMSFDVKSPDTSQMKYFLDAVEDVRAGSQTNKNWIFNTIVQPPKNNKSKENDRAFNLALEYAGNKGVPVTLLETQEVVQLARNLQPLGK